MGQYSCHYHNQKLEPVMQGVIAMSDLKRELNGYNI